MKQLALLILLCSAVGCSSTPDVQPYFSNGPMSKNAITVFDTKLALVSDYFDVLRSVGAQACLPGQVALIRKQLRSVRLESNAKLWPEAITRLDSVSREIKSLQCKLQSVQKSTACSMGQNEWTPLSQWYVQASYDDCQTLGSSSFYPIPTIRADITLFKTDSAELNKVAQASLTQWWKKVSGSYTGAIQITGHTDSRGREVYNQALSENRAKAVAEFLTSLGLDASKITLLAKGEHEPRIQEIDEFTRQLNRRVSVEAVEHKETF